MDWITHYMVAFILGRKMGLERNEMMAITLGALVLDFDVIFYLIPGLSHGTFTHTIVGMVLLGLAATLAMYGWKKVMLGAWIGLGILTHITLGMVNTFSIFEDGKVFFFPFSETVYTLEPLVQNPLLVWAVISAALFSFSFVMLGIYIIEGDYPWRVWYDERPLVEYWRGKFRG
jgi:membrane-bound metal-dependent hydrolase YbcI (DUF457 family)